MSNKQLGGARWNTPQYLNLQNDHVTSLTSESSPFGPFSLFHSCGDSSQKLNRLCSDSSMGFNDYNRVDDDDDNAVVGLSKVFSGISIFYEQGNGVGVGVGGGTKTKGFDIMDSSYIPCSLDAHVPFFSEGTGTFNFSPLAESTLNLNHTRKQGRTACYGHCDADWDVKSPFIFSQQTQPNLALNLNSASPCEPVAFNCHGSFVTQRKHVESCVDNVGICNPLRVCKENLHNEAAIHLMSTHNRTPESSVLQPLLLNFYSLDEEYGYIYRLAKHQNGCRFLQRVVDEGTSGDMMIVFEGVIDNVVELMMDPFGNYLVQKLLHVCGEDQRLNIVLMLTKEPRHFVKTSLNTHGSRVVLKLIETLSSRKQMLLVRSAIQSGFLDLVKDPNGNRVIQHCLKCFSCQDNEFIFEAAAKFCFELAIHRHGCCVLQRCIAYSMGKYQDKLVREICKYGLLLAQDPFGNYVVQYIIETGIPSALNKLISQFKGNYVSLSMQKFSSHVVEKCLKHVGESRSMIVKELLSAPHFEQLLQDPYANYVVRSALEVTKGSLHASLVEAVRPHQILRTSPYCKNIFSGSLLIKK